MHVCSVAMCAVCMSQFFFCLCVCVCVLNGEGR